MVRRWIRIPFWPLLLLLLALPSHAVIRTVEGTVTRVSDGDSVIVVTAEGTRLRTRLYGIDAPEVRHGKKVGQPFGEDAKRALSEMTLGKKVRLEVRLIAYPTGAKAATGHRTFLFPPLSEW
jgi:micrococcal nuclease